MKKELEKKDAETDETIDKLTSRHSHELGELKYQAQEAQGKLGEAQAEVERLRGQLDMQVEAREVREQVAQLQDQLLSTQARLTDTDEDNDRLREENLSVSTTNIIFPSDSFWLHLYMAIAQN